MIKNVITIIGCGWMGIALGKQLSAKGYEVYGSVTAKGKFDQLKEAGIKPFLLELGNRSTESRHEIPRSGIAIILLNPRVSQANFDELTQLLIKAGIRHILLASSTAVYPAKNSRVFESDAIHQTSPHSGVDMLSLEKAFDDRFPATIMRFAGLYGPGRHPARFFRSAKGGRNNPVNLIHLEDCIRAIEVLLVGLPAGTYNLCSDKHPSRIEFYTRASKSAGLSPPTFGNEDVPYKLVDNSLFKSTFEFSYSHPDPMEDFTI